MLSFIFYCVCGGLGLTLFLVGCEHLFYSPNKDLENFLYIVLYMTLAVICLAQLSFGMLSIWSMYA